MDKRKRKTTDWQIYGRLLSYIYPYLLIFFLSICGFAVSAAAQVAYAKWLEEIIEYVSNPIENYILLLPIALIIITLIRGLGFFVGNYLMAKISNSLVHSLRVDLFNKIPVLPTSFFDALEASVISVSVLGTSQRLHAPYNAAAATPSTCLLYTSPSPRDQRGSRIPASA